MRTGFIALIVVLLSGILLSGCTPNTTQEYGNCEYVSRYVKRCEYKNGDVCYTNTASGGGGIDCNFKEGNK